MALVQTTRGTENINQDQRMPDVSDKIWMIDPDYATLAFFARKLKKVKTVDPEYRHFEKQSPSRYDAVNYATNYTSGATTIAVDDGTKFRAGDVVLDVSTNEQMRVSSISTNDLTVSRGWGKTSATTVTDNDVLCIIGNANAEGASVRALLSSNSAKVVNYTQIFREPFGVTETDDATELLAEKSDLAGLRREYLQIHMKDMERSALFGEAKEDTSGAQPIRATGGLRSHISTNVTTEAQLTEAEFEDFISDIFQAGGDKKMGFASPLLGSAINSWAKGKLNMFPKDKTYGIAITNYLSVHGSLDFTLERILGENTTWNGYLFAVDMSLIQYRYLGGNSKNRDTQLLKNRQAAGDDQLKEEYLTEAGFQFMLENRHGYIKGVTSYAA
jgi:hypothetical protein